MDMPAQSTLVPDFASIAKTESKTKIVARDVNVYYGEKHALKSVSVDIVERFIDTSEPSEYDQAALRALLRTGGGEEAVTGPADTREAVLEAMGSDERSAT